VKCPHCLSPLLQIVDKADGRPLPEDKVKAKLRTPILIFDASGTKCTILCPKCRNEVDAPITLSTGAIQAARA
jgi:hypothetical protein